MANSIKVSILTVLGFPSLPVNGCRIQQKQRLKSKRGIEILLCLSAPLLFGFSPTVSFASPVQTVAQASPRVGVNRPNLKVGSQGDPVSELQAALKLLGFYTGTVDGVYNEGTAIAVSRFQEAAGLSPNGVVDTNTWQRLFPNDAIASTPATSRSSNNFPIPSQASSDNDGTVVVPSGQTRTTPVTNRAETLKPEPRPTTTTPSRASNLKPEPRPAGTPVATSSSNKPSTRQASSTRSNSSTTSRQATRSQQSNRTGAARQTTRSQQSTTSSGSSRKTQQTASLQYTSDGLPILRPGMRGSEVTRLQRRLQRLGYLEESAIDGDFGSATEAAVVSLQKRYGLEADGIVGGGTWEILNRRRKQ
ncbi:peptidoglycan-binding domain-containing protein [Scytonema sp. NUACC26]|uniref:peptidoglycan-binding domain-containing protein n=1 Tax=Scytonema sp. NUACC26 TaxID=3140176 RepID=UPI0034DC3FCB